MAVNTAALKTFAPAMRRQLMEAVGRKLDLLLNSQTPDTLSTYAKQIAELREEQEKSREQLLERVAYTWFNRLCALRYLDAKGWHPFGCKVLMPADASETQPELLKLMRSGSLPADLKAFTNEARLNQLLDGQIPTAIPGGDAQGEVYRELVLAACRSYHQLLPDLFEGLDDASELLLPDDLLTEGSIAGSFRSSISDSDCDDVEIIGWLYQFYISEKKDEVIGKVVKSEDIPAATQLFTPNWIVKYMVQNSLGSFCRDSNANGKTPNNLSYRVNHGITKDTEDRTERQKKITSTTNISVLDPACGSGHILTEAYSILKDIYLEEGYQSKEIPTLIFSRNLFGLDICPRAIQMTKLSLALKGREDDRRIFNKGIKFNIKAVRSPNISPTGSEVATALGLEDRDSIATAAANLFHELRHANDIGSLISIEEETALALPQIKNHIAEAQKGILESDLINELSDLTSQAELLARSFDIVIANPPYMGGRYMNKTIREFNAKCYPNSKGDLFAAFIERCRKFAAEESYFCLITMPSWLFLSSFEKLRIDLLKNNTLESLLHMGRGIFGIDFGSTCFVFNKSRPDKKARGIFYRLHQRNFQHIKVDDIEELFLRANREHDYRYDFGNYKPDLKQQQLTACGKSKGITIRHEYKQEDFQKVPGSPIAYWLSDKTRSIFETGINLGSIAKIAVGLQTGSNEKFVRFWPEVSHTKCLFDGKSSEEAQESKKKWFPYNKGGSFRKWYGNNELLVNWENNGYAVKHFFDSQGKPRSAARNSDYYFRKSITWSTVSSTSFGARLSYEGALFDVAGSSAFPEESDYYWILGLMCSRQMLEFMTIMNPTMSFQVGNISDTPIPREKIHELREKLSPFTKELISISKKDWDSYEFSFDFKESPLLAQMPEKNHGESLSDSLGQWLQKQKEWTSLISSLELKLNEEVSKAYGIDLTDPNKKESCGEPTIFGNPLYRYGGDANPEEKLERFNTDCLKEYISYATGCMMGRYSLDHPGLILADSRSSQDEQLAAYQAKIGKPISEVQFKPDADAIIPVLDGEWFEDDIVARTREFLKVTFPESSVAENLRFIEDSIGKDIRKYFCKDFYKDHLQTYKKRPIYWMVQSPKAGFACLIYLHRYTPDTLLQVLNNYFRPYLQKLEARQEQLERDQNNDALPKREQTAARKEAEKITKVLKECQAWEQDALLPLAQQRIALDLDDGVKVNYLKLQEVLAKIPGLAAKGD